MLIKGTIEYNNNRKLIERQVCIDTNVKSSTIDHDICDAVAFALYGKTIFSDIVSSDKGLPTVFLKIDCKEKSVYTVRRPQYQKVTHFGTKYIEQELFSLKTKDAEYKSMSDEKYYALIGDFVDLSYDEFVLYCRS